VKPLALQGALDSRVVIEQAKGLLAGARGIGLDQAFELLRTHARSNNLSLSELASVVVNMGLLLPSAPD
jgi:AmiR/NasT family two-component response regulator